MTICYNTTAPINLVKGGGDYPPCTEKCKLIYKYGLSHCIVTNKDTYLDIKCGSGLNTIIYGGISLQLSSVRLYLKSLNTYDGFHADGELILTHDGGGKNIYICIPVINSEKVGTSSKWFSKVIPFIPSKGGRAEIKVNNFTLDDVIPQSIFYTYEGTFQWGCNDKDEVIIFHKDQAINMKNRDFKTLASVIKNASIAQNTPKQDTISINVNGTINGPGESNPGQGKELTCIPIETGDGKGLLDTLVPSTKGTGSVGEKSAVAAMYFYYYFGIIMGIIVGLIIIAILGYIIKLTLSNRNSSVSSGSGGS